MTLKKTLKQLKFKDSYQPVPQSGKPLHIALANKENKQLASFKKRTKKK